MNHRLSFFVCVALLASLLCLGTAAPLVAHEDHPPKVLDEDLYRATPMPDRIILTWTGDPAHTQAVTWRTNPSVGEALAQIALAEPGPGFAEKAKDVPATTKPFESNLGPVHYHNVLFEDLEPSTRYVYRVGDGTNWSEWIQFSTASDKPEAFSFIYFGDAQNNLRAFWSRVIREAHRDAPKAAFMLHAGDLVNQGHSDAEWGEWFGAGAWLNAMVPSIATPGNHEYSRDPKRPLESRKVTRHWRPQFAFPENGPEGLKETVYWLDFQGTRIISLNSNEHQEEQAVWLDRVLTDNPNQWTVVTFHHPVYSTARGRDNPTIRKLWKPLFDKHKVDLVLQGHDHTYGRFVGELSENVPSGATARSPDGGTIYVVSVSGPKMYDLERSPNMIRGAQDTQLYQIISIDGDTLSYEARSADGRPYDAFKLKKRPGKTNELINEIPDTPERVGDERADD
ncbi:MAG: metallophosphoesterase [Planctomycetota bacterium]|nr:MAG: metallophosphoesterase [Planctomycetota bacterium]